MLLIFSRPSSTEPMILSTIKCRIELGTLFVLLCNLVCVNAFATLKMCVYRIEIFAKISRKKFAKSSEARFLQCFSRIFCKYWDPIHTHIWSVAKAWTHTKLHSSKNKVPSEILHLIVDDSFCHLYALFKILDILRVNYCHPFVASLAEFFASFTTSSHVENVCHSNEKPADARTFRI